MPLAAADATLADYAGHLRLLLAWQTPIESWLAGFADGPQETALLPPAPRAGLIARDLAEPGMPETPAVHAAGNWRGARSDAAYRWGVCYVLEGAQLGGAVLRRRLAHRMGNHPLRYLQGDARHGPGPRWQHFIRAMRAAVTSPEAIDSACRGACDAFDSLLALSQADRETAA